MHAQLREVYQSLIETLEIIGDRELMGMLGKGLREMEEGRTVSIEEVAEKAGSDI